MSTTRSDFAISIRVPAYRNGLLVRSDADEDRPAEQGSYEVEVVVSEAFVAYAQVVCSGMSCEPLLERAPVQALVAIPVVGGGGDDPGHPDALLGEPRNRAREADVALVVDHVRQRPFAPVRLTDGDEAAGRHGRNQPCSRIADVAPHEARAEAERCVPRRSFERKVRGIRRVHVDERFEAARGDACPGLVRELRAQLDADHAAAERRREDEGGTCLAAGDVENPAVAAESQVLA